jgi:hypothetical protein
MRDRRMPVHRTFKLKSATPYPSGVVGLLYERVR